MSAQAGTIQAGTYKNDFTDGNLDGWKIEDYGVQNVEWKVDNGILVCKRPHDWNTELFIGDMEWKNYSIECDVKMMEKLSAEYGLGLDLRLGDRPLANPICRPIVWCIAGRWATTKDIFIQAWLNCGPINSSTKDFNFELDHWYHFKGVANGNNIEFYIDGDLMLDITETHMPTGRIGLTANGCLAYFDNVVITGDDVPDSPSAIASKDKLATSWGQIKNQ